MFARRLTKNSIWGDISERMEQLGNESVALAEIRQGNDWRRGVSPMRRFQDPVRDVPLERYILRGVSPLNRPEGRAPPRRGVSPLNRPEGRAPARRGLSPLNRPECRAPTRRGVSPLNREDGNFGQDSKMAMTSIPLNRSHVTDTANKASVSGFIGTRQPLFKPPKLNLGIKSSTKFSNQPVDVSSKDLPEQKSDLSHSASSSSTSCSSSSILDLSEESMAAKHSAVPRHQTSPAKVPVKKVRFSQIACSSEIDEKIIKLRFSKPQTRASTIFCDEYQSEQDREFQSKLRPPPPPLVPYTGDANRRLVPLMSRLSLEDIQMINESRKRKKDMSGVHTGDVKKRKTAPLEERNEVTRPKQWWLRKRRQLRRKPDNLSSSSTSSSAVCATALATTTTLPGSVSSSCLTPTSAASADSSSNRRSVKRRAADDDCCSGDGVKRSRHN